MTENQKAAENSHYRKNRNDSRAFVVQQTQLAFFPSSRRKQVILKNLPSFNNGKDSFDVAGGVWPHVEKALSSDVFEAFIVCEGKRERKNNLNLTSCEYLLGLFTSSSVNILIVLYLFSVGDFNQSGCCKFDMNTSVVISPYRDSEAL